MKKTILVYISLASVLNTQSLKSSVYNLDCPAPKHITCPARLCSATLASSDKNVIPDVKFNGWYKDGVTHGNEIGSFLRAQVGATYISCDYSVGKNNEAGFYLTRSTENWLKEYLPNRSVIITPTDTGFQFEVNFLPLQ